MLCCCCLLKLASESILLCPTVSYLGLESDEFSVMGFRLLLFLLQAGQVAVVFIACSLYTKLKV